jgi:hypothetical protein
VFNDIAHDRVVESVKDPRRSHDDRYGSELGYAELSRNEDISHQITRKQVIYHVSSDCPQREEPQIFLSLSKIFVHKPALPRYGLLGLFIHFTISAGDFQLQGQIKMPPFYTAAMMSFSEIL